MKHSPSNILKIAVFIILSLITLISFKEKDRTDLLVGNWRQYAFKSFKDKTLRMTTDDCATKKISFKKDGTYQEEMFCLKSSGKWYFNTDQTKMGFDLDNFNGTKVPPFNDPIRRTNTLIIRLTNDTLIYGDEGYYGEAREYGHDDWYFSKQK